MVVRQSEISTRELSVRESYMHERAWHVREGLSMRELIGTCERAKHEKRELIGT